MDVNKMIQKVAVYPGTFDPITNGHCDIINRALRLFDKVIVVIGENTKKSPLFTVEERVLMIEKCFPKLNSRIEVKSTQGLIVDYAMENNAGSIIRGLRSVSDFDYEFQMALMNRDLEKNVDTVFLMTGAEWLYISSSSIKTAISLGGDVQRMVPEHVMSELITKYKN